MIRAEHITKTFSDREVLKDISAVFEPGKTNLIIGKSGSGKTVFLKCIVGLMDIDEGSIWYNDVLFSKLNFHARKEIRKEMGMLFQGSALYDSMTVEENVRFKLDRVNFCLNRVDIVNSNRLAPSELSGGMKKRVAIARAIALKPRYLFCDEPNSGLDPKTAIVIDELIREITEELNMTTIVNTHDMNSVMENGEKIIFIEEGEKCWEGNKNEILKSDCRILNEFVFANALAKQLKDTSG
jgi:phospholipid/cholesterol/gamma-HCH transport system ATP-binding protein